MADVSLDKVRKIMEDKNLAYWRIYDNDKKTLLNDRDDDETYTNNVGESYNDLEEACNDLQCAYVWIDLFGIIKKTQGGKVPKHYWYRLVLDASKMPQNSQSQPKGLFGAGGNDNMFVALFNKITALESEKVRLENKLEQQTLLQQIKDLKEGGKGNDGLDKIVTMVGAYLNRGNANPVASTPGIAGTEEVGEDKKEQNKQRLQAALNRFKQHDKNWLDNIEVLSKFCEQQNAMYNNYLPTLKGMVK